MTLRQKTFSGVRWSTFSSFGRAALQIVQISILARILTPADFGLVALVISIMAILQIFADAGISNAIIHYHDISQNQLSSLYWLNVGVSVFLALLLLVISPWVSIWYGQPEMKLLLLVAGGTLVVGALAQQIRVVAQKKLRFEALAKIEIFSTLFGFMMTVTSAFKGAGVYSIVVGSFTTATIGCALVWIRLAGGWRPQFRLNILEIREFLIFGAYMIGNNLANTFNSQIDIMLGGKILGSQAIGLYSMPRDLNLRIAGIINPIITNVGLPVMARAQNDKALLKRVYLQTMRMTASVSFPVYITLALFSPETVQILLGAKWEAAVPLLRIFSVWGMLRSIGNPIGSLLMACGRADISFRWNMALLIFMPPVIWGGSQYGASGMALTMAALMALLYWPNWYFQVRPLCGANFIEYSIQLYVPFALSLVGGGVGYLSVYLFSDNMIRLSLGLLVGAVVYIGLSWQYNRVWIMSMWELVTGSRFQSEKM